MCGLGGLVEGDTYPSHSNTLSTNRQEKSRRERQFPAAASVETNIGVTRARPRHSQRRAKG